MITDNNNLFYLGSCVFPEIASDADFGSKFVCVLQQTETMLKEKQNNINLKKEHLFLCQHIQTNR
jgi:hypothetical protein